MPSGHPDSASGIKEVLVFKKFGGAPASCVANMHEPKKQQLEAGILGRECATDPLPAQHMWRRWDWEVASFGGCAEMNKLMRALMVPDGMAGKFSSPVTSPSITPA